MDDESLFCQCGHLEDEHTITGDVADLDAGDGACNSAGCACLLFDEGDE